ncbi:MAG: carboxypeptidase-like regulatory domain-containing protein [Gemmataceae bacterium]|nr:carboxypeptidase-like regulatory domain-containing protein [Gemmataceae bacterium]
MNASFPRLLFSIAVCLIAPALVFAHGLGADAKVKDGKIHLEAYFNDDTPARDSRVEVTDDAGKKIAEGKTDEQGLWNFPLPPAGKYRVVVDAGEGHRAKLTIDVPAGESNDAKDVSEGPSRDEFTRLPWGRLAIGLAAIAVIGAALPWLLRRSRGS